MHSSISCIIHPICNSYTLPQSIPIVHSHALSYYTHRVHASYSNVIPFINNKGYNPISHIYLYMHIYLYQLSCYSPYVHILIYSRFTHISYLIMHTNVNIFHAITSNISYFHASMYNTQHILSFISYHVTYTTIIHVHHYTTILHIHLIHTYLSQSTSLHLYMPYKH